MELYKQLFPEDSNGLEPLRQQLTDYYVGRHPFMQGGPLHGIAGASFEGLLAGCSWVGPRRDCLRADQPPPAIVPTDILAIAAASPGLAAEADAGPHPLTLWEDVAANAPELAKLAQRILAVAVNAAGLERAFSFMGMTKSRVRNRLAQEKVTAMLKVPTHLKQMHPDGNQQRQHQREVATAVARQSAGGSAGATEAARYPAAMYGCLHYVCIWTAVSVAGVQCLALLLVKPDPASRRAALPVDLCCI